jgi:hypothetical protein
LAHCIGALARVLRIILLVSQNHTFGGCAANPNMLHRSKSIKICFALFQAGEKVLTPALHCSNHCCVEHFSCYPQRWAPLPRNNVRKCAKAFDPRATTQEYGHPGLSAGPKAPCPSGDARFVPLRLRPQLQRGLGKGTALLDRATAPTHDGGEHDDRQRRAAAGGCRARTRTNVATSGSHYTTTSG